jgi:hypothetical protein
LLRSGAESVDGTEKLTLTLDMGCAPITRCDALEFLQVDIERALDEAITRFANGPAYQIAEAYA